MTPLPGLDIGATANIGIVIDDQGATLPVESRPVVPEPRRPRPGFSWER